MKFELKKSRRILDFVCGGFAHRVARQLPLACLEKVLAPSVVQVRGDAFSAAQVGDALLASEGCEAWRASMDGHEAQLHLVKEV